MKNAMKKLMAFVLVAVMLVGALPFAAFATEGEPVAQAESYKVTMAVNWPDGTSAFAAQEKPIQYATASAQSLLTAYFATGYNEVVSISVNGTNVGTDTSYMVPSGANVVFVVSNCHNGHNFAEGPCDQVKTCTRHCGTTQPAGTHTWDTGEITTAAVCVTAGVKTYTCTACGGTKTETIPGASQHTWPTDGAVTTPATCIATGVKTYTCTVTNCGGTKTETIPALDHDWEAANCTAPKTCKRCHTVDSEALGHALRESITPATCTAPGEKVSECAVCDYEVKETIPALGHAPGTNGKCTRSGCTYEEALRYNVNYYLNYDNNFTPKTETVYKGHNVYNYIPSRYGYTFVGWYTTSGLTTRVADNATVSADSSYYAKWEQIAPHEVYVNVYINGNTKSTYAIVDLYGYAQDGVITKADIESAVKNYGLKAYNAAGLQVHGLFTPAEWAKYCADDYSRYSLERVNVDKNAKTVLYTMVHNVDTYVGSSSSSSYKADSTNPKTGDMIFAPMIVMGASASCLAVLYYLNKKRAI